MRSRWIRTLPIALGAGLAAAFLWSQMPHPPEHLWAAPAAPTQPVETGHSRRLEIPRFVAAVGTVRSRRQVQLTARIAAAVTRRTVEPGDRVAAGAVVVELDDSDLRSRLQQAEAELEARRQAEAEATTEWERARQLSERDAITSQERDLARFRWQSAVAHAAAALAAVGEANARLADAVLKAPFDGIVGQTHVDPGDLAGPDRPLLDLHDPTALRLEVAVEEELLAFLETGATLRVRLAVLQDELTGTVSEVVPAVDPHTRMALVRIDLPAHPSLYPGMFGRAFVPAGRRTVVAVPAGALVRRGQLEIVFEVEETPNGPRAALELVRTGQELPPPSTERLVEVLSGLAPDTEVVIRGAEGLQDGDRLTRATGEGPP